MGGVDQSYGMLRETFLVPLLLATSSSISFRLVTQSDIGSICVNLLTTLKNINRVGRYLNFPRLAAAIMGDKGFNCTDDDTNKVRKGMRKNRASRHGDPMASSVPH
eukprot:715953-Amorphochlora_amoeboformis.AAC.1